MSTMILEARNTVLSKIAKVFALRAYIPVGKMNHKQTDLKSGSVQGTRNIERKAGVPGLKNLTEY